MNNYINHIAFIIDSSGSMTGLSDSVVKVFDNQIKHLAQLSTQLSQETRVSVYLFDNNVKNLIFDMDVLRLPSLKTLYKTNGSTSLLDAVGLGISDLKQTCAIYGDHSYLLFCLTDGYENASCTYEPAGLSTVINELPDNWTVAVLVPDKTSEFSAVKFGFPRGNVQTWSTTEVGIEDAGNVITRATTEYMHNRTRGIRSSKNLFSLDTSKLNTTAVKKALKELKPSQYTLLPIGKDVPIKPLVEGFMGSYTLGSAYYLLTKPEKIQATKQICVQNKSNGKVYTGQHARNLLGLPDYEVRVSPVKFAEFNIYVQSTSVNRKLLGGTNVLVMT